MFPPQGHTYYDRPDNIELMIPHTNISGAGMHKKTEFAPSTAKCEVDETVPFLKMERSAAGAGACPSNAHAILSNLNAERYSGAAAAVAAMLRNSEDGGTAGAAGAALDCSVVASNKTKVDASLLPLQDNYKSCKSVLGGEITTERSGATSSSPPSDTVYSTTKTITVSCFSSPISRL